MFFYVLLTVYLSISLDNDQIDAQLLYSTTLPIKSSTCFDHYMLIIRKLNCIDATSGIVLSVSGRVCVCAYACLCPFHVLDHLIDFHKSWHEFSLIGV